MPLNVPILDARTHQELVDEALARFPVHTPEYTNFNKSDPGVTLVEVFAFLTENLYYRANLIPERNRLKFLSLLGLPLQPGAPARGLVTFSNDKGALRAITLNHDLEVAAGAVPFRTDAGLDVLPVEARVYYKRPVAADPALVDYYTQLYASYAKEPGAAVPTLYETVPLAPRDEGGVGFGDTLDGSFWVALLARADDQKELEDPTRPGEWLDAIRAEIKGKSLSLGIVPALAAADRRLAPGAAAPITGGQAGLLRYEIPSPLPSLLLPEAPSDRLPAYKPLAARGGDDVLARPAVVEIALPGTVGELSLWKNHDPLEAGVGDFPPSLDDADVGDRLITWVRVSSSAPVSARLLWVGINVAAVTQRTHVANEPLPAGTGEPDQAATLASRPVIPGTVSVMVISGGKSEEWAEIDDLLAADPEVRVTDPRHAPGAAPATRGDRLNVFALDPEAGRIRFGDGLRGRRPPFGAILRATYDCSAGARGNVGRGQITTSPSLPPGVKVSNPVRTWGGADPEPVSAAEKQIPRHLQHRDRLVSAADFRSIALRTPGVEIGRVEVLPAYHPDLGAGQPGGAPGAVTLMLIPRSDPLHPDAPEPDCLFLDAVCAYLDPRRLVTTEILLRGPQYRDVWVSLGIDVVAGHGTAEVREAVKDRLLKFLAPLAPDGGAETVLGGFDDPADGRAPTANGWPLGKAVVDSELMAVASRVPGVLLVRKEVLLADGAGGDVDSILMSGLQLPRVAGINVTDGDPVPLDQLRQGAPRPAEGPAVFAVPFVPEDCG